LGYEEDELSNEVKDRIIKDVEQNWWFCGGRDTHIENDEDEEHGSIVSEAQLAKWEALWEHYFPGRAMPEPSHECVCNKGGLRYNCFITNGKKVLIIGRVCLKQFLPKQHQEAKEATSKRCDRCKAVHRNRKDNYCNDCRSLIKAEQEMERYNEEKKEWERLRREQEQRDMEFRRRAVEVMKQQEEEKKERERRQCGCGGWKPPQYPECWDCRKKRLDSLSETEKKKVLCPCGKMKKPQFATCWSCRGK
jgi:hypothetical protein